MWPYKDTPNNGGEYTLAVCKISLDCYIAEAGAECKSGTNVAPANCKYDNFKVCLQTEDIGVFRFRLPVGRSSSLPRSPNNIVVCTPNSMPASVLSHRVPALSLWPPML